MALNLSIISRSSLMSSSLKGQYSLQPRLASFGVADVDSVTEVNIDTNDAWLGDCDNFNLWENWGIHLNLDGLGGTRDWVGRDVDEEAGVTGVPVVESGQTFSSSFLIHPKTQVHTETEGHLVLPKPLLQLYRLNYSKSSHPQDKLWPKAVVLGGTWPR